MPRRLEAWAAGRLAEHLSALALTCSADGVRDPEALSVLVCPAGGLSARMMQRCPLAYLSCAPTCRWLWAWRGAVILETTVEYVWPERRLWVATRDGESSEWAQWAVLGPAVKSGFPPFVAFLRTSRPLTAQRMPVWGQPSQRTWTSVCPSFRNPLTTSSCLYLYFYVCTEVTASKSSV